MLEHIHIRPPKGFPSLNLKELWRYRELLYLLVWRDVKVRYKQTFIGIGWVIIQPFFSMIVFSFIFGRWAKIPSDGIPYPIFAFCSLLPWQLFSRALSDASTSLVTNERIITKMYFPRIIVPTSAIFSALIDFLIAFVLLIGLMFYYGVTPTVNMFAFPFFLALTLITALGIGFWLSALDVKYRDVRYVLPFLTQLLFFITPIVYASSLVPEKHRLLFGLNPLAGIMEGFRWSLLDGPALSPTLLISSILSAVFVFVGGVFYFRQMEKTFADII